MRRYGALRAGVTARDYLESERSSSEKHEFYAGETFAMAGNSRAHNIIVANLVRELSTLLRDRPCEVYPSDMRVKVEGEQFYTYPDVVVVCGEPEFEEDENVDTLLNPTVLFEVLSDSTEAYDRGKKFELYRAIASLRDYVLVAQDEPLIERFVRQPNETWAFNETRRNGHLPLSVGVELSLAEVYLKVL